MIRFLHLPLMWLALPAFAADRAQVSVQWEWIRLPHAEANQLIHQHLKASRDADALRDAVLAMVKRKEAARLDLQALSVEEGQRAKLDSTVQKSYPTEFDPGQVPVTLTVQGPNPAVEVSPVVPNSFAFRKLGRMAELEVGLIDDGQLLDLEFKPVWTEHLGDMSYGQKTSEVKQPVFFTAQTTTDLLLTSGVWQLAGLFTPPPDIQKDVKPELAPLPGDRVLLFVKASSPGLPGTPPKAQPDDADQVTVLSEWIELDLKMAAELLLENPDASSSAALRESVKAHLAAGRARLVETALVPCRLGKRAKIESIREVPYPTEFDAARLPQTLTLLGPPPAAPLLPGTFAPWIVPATCNCFTFRNTGVTMEVDCSVVEGDDRVTLKIAPELCQYLGRESFGLGPAMGTQPRFQTLKSFADVRLLPGTPALISTLDAPQSGDALPGSARARKAFHFVTIIR